MKFSTFELHTVVAYGKSVNPCRREQLQKEIYVTFKRSRDFAHAQKLMRLLMQGRALFWKIS